MRGLLVTLLLTSAAHADAVSIFFDARAPFVRPMVRAEIAGATQSMALDTGAVGHAWSLAQAKAARVKLGAEGSLLDYQMRTRKTFALDQAALLDGLFVVATPLVASDWADERNREDPSAPHFDGILSPQNLVRDGRALVLDFRAGLLSEAPWAEATEMLSTFPYLLADVPIAGDGHFLVDAREGERMLRMAIDTGAPRSLLYERRGDELPEAAVRFSRRTVRFDVGSVHRHLGVDQVEPLAPPGFDGLIGMDVLRDCALALDHQRLLVRCANDHDDGAAAGNLSLLRPRVIFTAHGPALEERANGAYRYRNHSGTLVVDLLRDGTVKSSREMRRDEIEEVLEPTALARYQVAHAEALRTSFERLPRLLARVWNERRWSVAERRELLFRIWDEAAEPDDPELGAAGAHARKMIATFVQHDLPHGSPNGFTDDELARFNARRPNGPRFNPYTPAPHEDRGVAMGE